MAHDAFDLKAEAYLYDKIFHQEFDINTPAVNIANVPIECRSSTRRNNFLLNYIKQRIQDYPNYTVQQFNTLFHKELSTADWLRYFKDYVLKHQDLPVPDAIITEMYHKLFGVPLNNEAAFGHSNRLLGRDIKKSGRLYKQNIYDITRRLIKQNPKATSKDLEKIIYQKYPVESELLLDYARKYKHIMK